MVSGAREALEPLVGADLDVFVCGELGGERLSSIVSSPSLPTTTPHPPVPKAPGAIARLIRAVR